MTPLKDISGLNRPLQGIEGEEKARRVRSAKALQTTESKNVKETQALFDRKDKVEITSKGKDQISQKENIARYVREIKQLPSQNSQDFSKIQQRIESDFYSKPEVLNKVAESILGSFKPASIGKEKVAGKKSLSDQKLNRIRENIQSGEYESDKILNAITDELLKIV